VTITDDEIRAVRDRAGELAQAPEILWVASLRNAGMPVAPNFLNHVLTELLTLREFKAAVTAAWKRIQGEP
jgi:hypothetical protein